MTPSVFDDRQITVYSCTSADKQIDQRRFKKIFVIPPKYVTSIIGLQKVTFYVRDLWILSEWTTRNVYSFTVMGRQLSKVCETQSDLRTLVLSPGDIHRHYHNCAAFKLKCMSRGSSKRAINQIRKSEA